MGKKMIVILPILFAFFIFPIAVGAEDISLSFDITFDSLGLLITNNSAFKSVKPFKRGVASVFLISSPAGHLFTSRNWKLLPANSFPNGIIKSLPANGEREPRLFAFTPVDLSEFTPLDASLPRPTELPRLFVKGLIKHPQNSSESVLFSPIFELTVQNKRISKIQVIQKASVPHEVDLAMNREIEKIFSEEKSPQFGNW